MKNIEPSPDRISQLPNTILHQILFYLPAKDATRTSVLSKSWHRLFKSLPVLEFFPSEPTRLWELLPQESTDEARSQNLVRLVDHALQLLHTHKVIYERFAFKLILSRGEFVSPADLHRWIELATKNPIKDFICMVKNEDGRDYELPRSVFALNSYTRLNLSYFHIPTASFCGGVKFSCLKQLGLSMVTVDEHVLQKLLDSCPVLESFSLRHSSPRMKFLGVLNCPSLKTFSASSIDKIQIRFPNLEVLKCVGCGVILDLDKPTWRNLKALISLHGRSITNESLEQVIQDCSSLDYLDLDIPGTHRIRVSSHCLKRLCLRFQYPYQQPPTIEIDAPNLCYCRVITYQIPSEFSISSSKLQEIELEMGTSEATGIKTTWFCDLRRYLSKIQIKCKFSMRLSICFAQPQFQYEELRDIDKLPPLPSLGTLILDNLFIHGNNSSLLDGVLWSCRPETLSLTRRPPMALEFFDYVFEALMSREEDPKCCGDSEIKCWKHYLKDANALWGGDLIQQLPLSLDGRIDFKLKW